MFKRISRILLALSFTPILAIACSSQSAAPAPRPQASLPAMSNGENAGGAEAGGVEAALVTYTDTKQGFSIGHPSSWTQDPSVTSGVKFVGGDDWMKLEFIAPSSATALAYAQSDVASVSAAFPNFKQISLAPSAEVQNAIILGFTSDGKSAVTGKPFTAHNERYYMPLRDGRIAILTVFGPENHYDQQGVRDIALTLQVTQ